MICNQELLQKIHETASFMKVFRKLEYITQQISLQAYMNYTRNKATSKNTEMTTKQWRRYFNIGSHPVSLIERNGEWQFILLFKGQNST